MSNIVLHLPLWCWMALALFCYIWNWLRVSERPFRGTITPLDTLSDGTPDNPSLMMLYPFGLGVTMFNAYDRFTGETYPDGKDGAPQRPRVYYSFITVGFFPLIPVDCFVARKAGLRSWNIYGRCAWRAREVVWIYIRWISMYVFGIAFFWSLL